MKRSGYSGEQQQPASQVEHKSSSSGSVSEEQEENFVSGVQKNTQKMINDNKLDSIGFEDEGGAVLDVWLEDKRMKQEGIPLVGLISKVKEISGLMPILKKIMNRQIEQEMFLGRWEQELQSKYLLKTQMTVDFSAFEQEVETRVKNRLDIYDKKF